MNAVRFGIIGMGIQGMTYGKLLTGKALYPGMAPAPLPRGCNLAAVSSRGEEKKALCGEQFPGVPFFTDWKEMVQSGLIDAVVITVPHYQHCEIMTYCLERGIHVFCDKPAGVYARQVREMVDCAKAHPESKFGLIFNQRANPVYAKAKQILSSGELGAIRRSNIITTAWWRPDSYYSQSPWRGTWGGEGGGILLNQAVHQLDLWLWLCGMPTSVYSLCRYGYAREIQVENDVTVTARYGNGAVGSFIASAHDPIGTTRFEIDLDGGKMLIEDGRKLTVHRLNKPEQEMNQALTLGEATMLSMQGKLYTTEVYEDDGKTNVYTVMFENFAAHILNGTALIAPGEEGLHSTELINGIALSDWLEKPLTMPVDEEPFIRELNKRIRAEGQFPLVPER